MGRNFFRNIWGLAAAFGACTALSAASIDGESSKSAADLPAADSIVEIFDSSSLANKSVLFCVRKNYIYTHHNTDTAYPRGEITAGVFARIAGKAALVRVDFDKAGKAAKKSVIAYAPDGYIRDVSASFDAKEIVFSMRLSPSENFRIYTADADGGNLRRITNLADAADIDPVFLPNGRILFGSSRASKYCGCNRHMMNNLYSVNPDGTNVLRIGNSIEFEHLPSVMNDGRILYTRWEYVDRNFSGAQGLWTCNPDGTRHQLYWGQETKNPALFGREMPGGRLVVCILSSCHDLPWGALALIDRKISVEGEKSVAKIFPKNARPLIDKPGDKWADSMKQVELKYTSPKPLSESEILVSRQISKGGALGLYLVDIDSSAHALIARAKAEGYGIDSVEVLAARELPASIPEQHDYSAKDAYVYLSDVYEGTHMRGIKKGDIKYLRIIEDAPKISWCRGAWENDGQQAPCMNFDDYDRKIELGIVPVEEDGSAYFKVPPDRFLYLQALDKDKRMVQTMRSGFSALPGETVSCSGCHENRNSPPPISYNKTSLALRRPPKEISPTAASGESFSYIKKIQPIFAKNCFPCHDKGGKGKVDLSADAGLVFPHSYYALHKKKSISAIGAGPDKIPEANTWGAKQSKMIQMLDSGHNNVRLSKDEFETLQTWIDLNAPCYSTSDCAYPQNPTGRTPLSREELRKLFSLCGKDVKVFDTHTVNARRFPGEEPVSFDRPELSKILEGVEGQNRAEALKLIRLGAERLKSKPRADTAGFENSPEYLYRQKRFELFEALETAFRKAELAGEKMKDPNSLEEFFGKEHILPYSAP